MRTCDLLNNRHVRGCAIIMALLAIFVLAISMMGS